jgi:hypothetical protein
MTKVISFNVVLSATKTTSEIGDALMGALGEELLIRLKLNDAIKSLHIIQVRQQFIKHGMIPAGLLRHRDHIVPAPGGGVISAIGVWRLRRRRRFVKSRLITANVNDVAFANKSHLIRHYVEDVCSYSYGKETPLIMQSRDVHRLEHPRFFFLFTRNGLTLVISTIKIVRLTGTISGDRSPRA